MTIHDAEPIRPRRYAIEDHHMLEGTVLLMMTFPWPWPCRARAKLVERDLVAIFAERNGSLTVRIGSDGEVVEFQSCRLVFDAQTSTNVGISWKLPGSVNMIVGQTIVLSTDRGELEPIEARIVSGVPNDIRDFSKENAEALARRRDALIRYEVDKKVKEGRRDASVKEIFDALDSARQQIVELVKLVGERKLYHIDGLLRLLRLTVADRTAKPLPLLQLCAAMTASPLLVFAPPINANRTPLPIPGVQTFAFSISAVATDLLKNSVDLDVWLELRAAQLDGRVLSQSELLNNIASSVAAHFDTQVRTEADLLRSWKSEIAGVDSDFVAPYALAISSTVRDISGPILERRPA